MRMERKKVLKDDGRYLVYYHFPDTAGAGETEVFNAIKDGETQTSPAPAATSPSSGEPAVSQTGTGGKAHV